MSPYLHISNHIQNGHELCKQDTRKDKERQCKHKELNSALPAYTVRFVGGEEVLCTCAACGTGLSPKSLRVAWRLKHSLLALLVQGWQWAASPVWRARCHHCRERAAKSKQWERLPWLAAFILTGSLRYPSVPQHYAKQVHILVLRNVSTLHWIGIRQSSAGHHC